MRRLVPLSAVLVFAVAASFPIAQETAPRRVLYLTQSMGYKHEVLPLSEKILVEVGQKHGFAVTVSGDASAISAESLKPYFAVVFYTTGELPMKDEQKAALMAWIRAGHGFVGIHSATDTFYKWPEYGEMIGGYFDEHPWNTQVTMKVEDHGHPSTTHLGATWTVADEIYQFKNYSRRDKHVLLSLDVTSVDLTAKGVKRADRDFANAWYKSWGSGRVFYTALGHRPEVWQDPAYQQHVAGGISWAMGGK
jgi:type 1 glutamine amidotransferase